MGKRMLIKKKMKKEAILDAAVKLFSQKGFHKTKTLDIAKEANVAEGTIYLYFKSKDDVLIQAYKKEINKILEDLKAKALLVNTSRERILDFVKAHINLIQDDPNLGRFLIKELRQSSEFYDKYPEFTPLKDYFCYLQEIIQSAIDNNEIRSVSPEILASIIFGTMDLILTKSMIQNDVNDLEMYFEQTRDILLNGILKK